MRLSAYLCMLIEFGLILGPTSTLLLPGAGDPLNGQKKHKITRNRTANSSAVHKVAYDLNFIIRPCILVFFLGQISQKKHYQFVILS